MGYPGCIANTKASSKWKDNCTPPSPAPWQVISSGPYALDVGAAGGDVRAPSGSYFTMSLGHAIAVRFWPTSRFMPYITLHDVVSLLSGAKTVVEIRANDPATNLPVGAPGDSNILARSPITLPVATLPYDCGGNWLVDIYNYDRAVPINGILGGTEFVPDTPYWIVFYADGFVCSDAYIAGYERVKFATSNTGRNDVALWSQSGGCSSWAITTLINSISFATYKTSTGTPAINVTDFGFAQITPAMAYANTNCFGSRAEMNGKNVAVGIDFSVPRNYASVRFFIVYRRPDGTHRTFTADLSGVAIGAHEVFVDAGELYMPGVYTELSVSAAVLAV